MISRPFALLVALFVIFAGTQGIKYRSYVAGCSLIIGGVWLMWRVIKRGIIL